MEIQKLLDRYKEIVRERSEVLRSIRTLIDLPNGLDRREKMVLRRRFSEMKTLNEIGKELDITCERVRQIENKAMEKLKSCQVN